MEVYIAAVEGLLTDRIVPAHGSALPDTMSISSPRLQSASSAEVYFEFYADDAVSPVEGLRASAIRATENPVWRDFIGSRIEGGLVMNAPYISIPLTKTVQLVIYAKQSRLLRLEVRYSEDIREHAFHRRQRGTSRTLSETLRALKHDAASRLTQLLRGFAMHLTNTNGRCDLLDLLDAIGRVTERNPARARELLAQFVNFGGVTQTDDDGIAPARVIRRLERDGILTRHSYRHGNAQPGAPRYALSPPYSGMIEHLVAEADGTRPPAGTTMN